MPTLFSRPYLKKDGSLMFYINSTTKVSVGYGVDVKVTKLTTGQQKLLKGFFKVLNNTEPVIKNFEPHEPHQELSNVLYLGLKIYITDKCSVCGNHVNSDGCYVEYGHNLYDLSCITGEY